METNPKKSKAFIITFVAILLLLIVGYLIFKNSDKIFGTAKGSSLSKIFAPLLGTSKQKDLSTINNQTNNNGKDLSQTSAGNDKTIAIDTSNNGSNTSGNSSANGSNTGNNLSGYGSNTNGGGKSNVLPPFNPLPNPTTGTNCYDKNGKLISCTNGNGTNVLDNQNSNNNVDTTNTNNNQTPSILEICNEDPLEFTTQEQADIDTLLKKYYLIAPAMKSDDDIKIISDEIAQNQSTMEQAKSLTNDCKVQKSDPNYTGPQTIKDNPYYQGGGINNPNLNYLPGLFSEYMSKVKSSGGEPLPGTNYKHNPTTDYSELEALFNIW